jgi:hypothetical protein
MKTTLALIMCAVGIVMLAYEFFAIVTGDEEATVSRSTLEWSMMYPIIALELGILLGHFFWPQRIRVQVPHTQIFHHIYNDRIESCEGCSTPQPAPVRTSPELVLVHDDVGPTVVA